MTERVKIKTFYQRPTGYKKLKTFFVLNSVNL